MRDEHSDVFEGEGRLDEILGAYFEALAASRAPDRQALLARHPDLADDLSSFFADQEAVDRWTVPLRPVAQAALTEAVAAVLTPPPEGGLGPTSDVPLPFGGYELLEEIGRGGMGVVYKARQKVPSRLVALKVIRAGWLASPAEVRRFRAEAEAAASLDHPNIVPIYEVGDHAGQPFFSTKLVEGSSLAAQLARYRDEPQAAARLMVTLARAVQHAHQRGVLHRDLKPSNVLLDGEGRPHVTDFGLAKRLEKDGSLTESGALVGTPSYMAPEQAGGMKGAVTTATDLYGLGAVLYALLTGRPPFRADTAVDTLLLVREREPEPPRRVNARVDRDLETICLKCLQKEPARRYGSAEAVAEDLERWLAGKSIEARRSGSWERLWKWVRRRPALAGLVIVSALGVLGLLGGLLWHNAQLQEAAQREHNQAEQARRERDAAEEERRWVRQAADDLYTEMADKWLARRPHLELVQREMLEKALRFYQHLAQQDDTDPSLRDATAQAHYRLATLQLNLAHPDEAVSSFRKAITRFTELVTEFPHEANYLYELSACYDGLGQALQATGHPEEAGRAYQESISRWRKLVAEFPARPEYQRHLAGAKQNQAMVLAEVGKVSDAEQAYHEAMESLQELVKASPDQRENRSDLANVHSNLGNLLVNTRRYREAEQLYGEAIAAFQKLAEELPAEPQYREGWAYNLCNLAAAMSLNRTRDAPVVLRQAVTLLQRLADDYPAVPDYQFEVAMSQGNLGIMLRKLQDFAGAEESYRRAIAAYRKLIARSPAVPAYRQNLGYDEKNLGNLLGQNLGRPKEAEEAYGRALKVQQGLDAEFPTVPGHRKDLADVYDNLAALLRRTGRLRAAEDALSRARKLWEDLVTAAPDDAGYRGALAGTSNNLALVLVWDRDPPCPEAARAVALASKAVELDPKTANHWLTLGVAQYRMGNCSDSLAALQKARELGAAGDATGWFAAMACWRLGNEGEARRRYAEALQGMDRKRPEDERLRRFRTEAARLLRIES